MSAEPLGELFPGPAHPVATGPLPPSAGRADDGVGAMTASLASRAELTDRTRRVLHRLLADHRWPEPQSLPRLLPTYVGGVLSDHPLTERDNSARIRISGGAAAYCWDYLPATAWRLLDRPAVALDDEGTDEGSARPLMWAGAHGVVADRIYVGLHRRLDAVTESSWAWAQEWSQALGTAITAVRVIPLAQRPAAQLVTADGPVPLAGTDFDAIGGVWR